MTYDSKGKGDCYNALKTSVFRSVRKSEADSHVSGWKLPLSMYALPPSRCNSENEAQKRETRRCTRSFPGENWLRLKKKRRQRAEGGGLAWDRRTCMIRLDVRQVSVRSADNTRFGRGATRRAAMAACAEVRTLHFVLQVLHDHINAHLVVRTTR